MDTQFANIIARFREEIEQLSVTNSKVQTKLHQISSYIPVTDTRAANKGSEKLENPYIVGILNDLIDDLARQNAMLNTNLDHLNELV